MKEVNWKELVEQRHSEIMEGIIAAYRYSWISDNHEIICKLGQGGDVSVPSPDCYIRSDTDTGESICLCRFKGNKNFNYTFEDVLKIMESHDLIEFILYCQKQAIVPDVSNLMNWNHSKFAEALDIKRGDLIEIFIDDAVDDAWNNLMNGIEKQT